MSSLGELISRVKGVRDSLKDGSLIRYVLDTPANEQKMKDLQIEQLDEGIRSDGTPIAPSIFEDTFFKRDKSARKYAEYKQKRFPNPNRPLGAPNLRLSSGLFHKGFYPEFLQDGIVMQNKTLVPDARGVMHDVYAKYGAETFGLTDENWAKMGLKDLLIDNIRATLIG